MSAHYWGFPHVCFPPLSHNDTLVLGLLYFTLIYIYTDFLLVHRYRLGLYSADTWDHSSPYNTHSRVTSDVGIDMDWAISVNPLM